MQFKPLLFGIFFVALLFLPTVNAVTFEVISATYTPAPASAGKLIQVFVTIQNKSNSDSDPTTITIKPEYPFSLSAAGKSEKTFSTILSGKTALAVLELQTDNTALNGLYTVEIQVKEGDAVKGYPLAIQVTALKPQIEILSITENTAAPGQNLQTTLTIRNVGSSVAKNIFIGTSEDRTVTSTGLVIERPIKSLGTGLVFVESLEPNQNTDVLLNLGVDSTAEQKTHLVPIKIKYQDTNRSEFEVGRFIGILIRGNAEIDGDITANPTMRPYPGATTEFNVSLYNRGTATAKNLVVQIQENPIWEIQSEKKIFIGTLDPDDFDSFNLTAKIKQGVLPGTYPITLLFDYKNQDNQASSVPKTIPITIYSESEAKSATTGDAPIWNWLIPLLVILGIGYFAYQKFVKKSNNAKK